RRAVSRRSGSGHWTSMAALLRADPGWCITGCRKAQAEEYTMINNERQYRASLRQRKLLAEELDRLTSEVDVDEQPLLAVPLATRLMRASLEGQLADLDAEIREYEALRSGAVARI